MSEFEYLLQRVKQFRDDRNWARYIDVLKAIERKLAKNECKYAITKIKNW